METEQDIVMMKNGQMMVVRHGEEKPLDIVMTLSNGTRVMMDGTITMADGTSRRLMDGEAMTMDGEMTTVADMKNTTDNMEEDKTEDM